MIAKFNATGTHIQKGYLKVRLDLYPDIGDKTYLLHYVDKPDRPYTQEELEDEALQALVPKHKELNPCLCHFIKVNPDISLTELVKKVKEYFNTQTKLDLDDALSKFDIQRVQQIMKTKLGDGQKVLSLSDVEMTKLNSSLSLLEVKV